MTIAPMTITADCEDTLALFGKIATMSRRSPTRTSARRDAAAKTGVAIATLSAGMRGARESSANPVAICAVVIAG
jgi:hypothetical protein